MLKFAICLSILDARLENVKRTRTRQHSVNVRLRTVAGSHEEKGNGVLSVGGACSHLLVRDWLCHGRTTEAPLALIKHFGTPSRLRDSRISSLAIRSPTTYVSATFV